MCRAAAQSMVEFAEREGIKHELCRKLVVAPRGRAAGTLPASPAGP